jgi:predicted porin
MKKSLFALAVLGAFTGVASAQSSVTLSGGVDVGVARLLGDTKVQTSNSGRSKIALSGTEDLGGGMRAFFLIEHRFAPNDGTINGSEFYRHSYVGLGGAFGDVRLGRIRMPLRDLSVGYSAFAEDTVATTATFGSQATDRANNAIYYRSPSLGGLQVHAAIAAAEGQNTTPVTERPAGAAVSFGSGPISAAVAYDRNGQNKKTKGIYASYDLGMAKLMGQFDQTDKFGVIPRERRASLGALVPLGAATFKASFGKRSGDKKQIGVGLDYSLSKRTLVYTDVAKWSGNGYTTLEKKTRADVGISHKF